MQAYLDTKTDETKSPPRLMDKAKQITELKELTLELIQESVDIIMCSHRDTLTASYYFHSNGEHEVNFHSPVLKNVKIRV